MKAILILSCLLVSNMGYCGQPDSTWLDFWVGTWNAEWENPDGSKGTAVNKISKVLGDKIVEENFEQTGVPQGQAFKGRSYSAFIKAKGIWKQTWVDNGGSYLDFISSEENGNPVFQRSFKGKDGKTYSQRMVFYNIKKESFDWRWENSSDEGITWNLSWKIHYSRKS